MKRFSRFDETKIKMVMKLRKISREDAIRELHIAGAEVPEREETHASDNDGDCLITAEEFLGEIDDDDDLVTADDFFNA